MKRRNLDEIAAELSKRGLDAAELVELSQELEVLEQPPGVISKVTTKARDAAIRQWTYFVGELKESKEAMGLVLKAVKRNEPLTPEERDKVRDQLVDLVKVFPAGVIAAANSAVPIPGTSVFTPWILSRLNLMPSHWREAHLLAGLERQSRKLALAGQDELAGEIDLLCKELLKEASRREAIGNSARLLTHWDENRNGVWDESEKRAYREELSKLRQRKERHGARKRWFFEHEGAVFGAHRLSEIVSGESAEDYLVCFDGKTGWVALSHVFGAEPKFRG